MRRIVGILCVGLVVAVSACDSRKSEEPDPPPTMLDMVSLCSPFETLDGKQSLSFEEKNVVQVTRVVAPDLDEEVTNATHVTTIDGTFSVQEATRLVTIKYGGTTSVYTFQRASGGSGCILLAGSLTAADMTKSWFGEPADDPPDPDEGSGP